VRFIVIFFSDNVLHLTAFPTAFLEKPTKSVFALSFEKGCAHLKRQLYDGKIIQKMKKFGYETDMKFKNLLLYKICLIFFLYQI
jgi:hypothetical protein